MAAFQAGLGKVGVRQPGGAAAPEPFVDQFVSGNYFSMFGIRPFAGRLLSPADDTRGAAPVAVMSYRAWQQHYSADSSVIGATFIIDGAPFTIAGIAPPGFFGDTVRPDPPDFWMPLADEPFAHPTSSLLDGEGPALALRHRPRQTGHAARAPGIGGQCQARASGSWQTFHPMVCQRQKSFERSTSHNARRRWRNHHEGKLRTRPAAADVHHRPGPPDNVRQPGQPATGARRVQRCADSHPGGTGSAATPPDPPDADGERSAGHRGRSGWGYWWQWNSPD